MEDEAHTPDFMAMMKGLTNDDVKAFFETVPDQGACPICRSPLVAFTAMTLRSDGYITQHKREPAILMRPVHTPKPRRSTLRLPAITTCCDVCGFIAEFSVAPILEWKAKQSDGSR